MNSRTNSRSRGVPAYAPNGDKLRFYSLEAVQRLLALTPRRCSAKTNKRTGQICSIQFLPAPTAGFAGNETLRKTAHMGQYYSYQDQIEDGSGRHVWSFARFLVPRAHGATYASAEADLKKIFRAVPLSCMTD